jgi:NADH-quinone oxidoreductase subunit H
MGVVLAAFTAVAALLVGALLTLWLEPNLRAASGGGEAGPAAKSLHGRTRPAQADPWMYYAGPIVALFGVAWAMVCLPWGRGLIPANVNIGLFYFIVVVDFAVLGIALGGWGANTPGSVESCYRIVAQLIAYIVPLGLAIIGPIMMARSLSTVNIVEAQRHAHLWYIAPQLPGFALYLVTALMQVYRAPFLEPFAEWIGHGTLGAYGGWLGLLWRLVLAAVLFVVAAMGAVLFLGGYAGPLLPGWLWMLIKTFAVMALMLWLGRQVRLASTADMLALAWKVLIPAGLVNVLLVGALILLGVGQGPFPPVGSQS